MLFWFNQLSVFLLTSFIVMRPIKGTTCRWDQCSKEFQETNEESSLDDGESLALCQALGKHIRCLDSLSKPCRGNLHYHSYVKGVTRVYSNTNCTDILLDTSSPHTPPWSNVHQLLRTDDSLIILPAYHGCSTINLTSDIAYCSVFGDPHIITERGKFQTCSIFGAYPLIENAFLAVQVSSKHIRHSSYHIGVTAISRITVIIKATECSKERKTYEAVLGHLPLFFTDYTTDTATVKLMERIPNRLIEIQILHLRTIIFIRQIGEYMAIGVRLPDSLINIESAARYQLCSAGCPSAEILSRKEITKDLPFRLIRQAAQWCQRHNLTGPFYEACFFDFLLTQDFDSVRMSKEAQHDWERLAPFGSLPAMAWTKASPDIFTEIVQSDMWKCQSDVSFLCICLSLLALASQIPS